MDFSTLLFGIQHKSPFGMRLGPVGKPPFRSRVPLVLTVLAEGGSLGGSSHLTGVSRGGGGGGFGFRSTVRIAEGCAGGLMSGAPPRTLIFSKLEAVVLLELLLSVSVLELSVISSSSCRSDVSVSIWSTTCTTDKVKHCEVLAPVKTQKNKTTLSTTSFLSLSFSPNPFIFLNNISFFFSA